MVFLANLGVNLHVCLCGDLEVASASTLDFLDIGQKSSFPDWKPGSPRKSFPGGIYLDHWKMVFLADLGVNLQICFWGDLRVYSTQTFDCIDIDLGLAAERWDGAPAGCEG
ncbi:hypothetical protein TRIP_B200594 [uncultured Desulfatiglans sp.]|uniref:Uncharacterized protein n=1 Tax=Uncultured Desulfatiglans sp. TaxID=1748965 RepID=A0A653A379_UNCDX|nr:hypothetical protein TRIP_B200594 [uncultured Desulfatiglans sp.]